MPSPGLQWQPLQIPLAAGLDTKADARAGNPPGLDICRDVQFDEEGGLQTRKPYIAQGSDIEVGGLPFGSITNARRLAQNGDELLLFTRDQLYSWSEQEAAWQPRGQHLAVAVDEVTRFASNADQTNVDRAELNGVVLFVWSENQTGSNASTLAVAMDKTTGAVLAGPTQLPAPSGPATNTPVRPRVVALASRLLIFAFDVLAANIVAIAVDPAVPGSGLLSAWTPVMTVAAGAVGAVYDVVKVEGQDLAVGVATRNPTGSHVVFKVTAALVCSESTKARAADLVSIATSRTAGTTTRVARTTGTNVLSDDMTTTTLADIGGAVGTVVGTFTGTASHVTHAYFNATDSQVFWSSNESTGASDFVVSANLTSGTAAGFPVRTVRHQLGIASRAFAGRPGSADVFVWLVFAGASTVSATANAPAVRAQLQNTYFLYDQAGRLASRAADDIAGGLIPAGEPLPGVQLISDTTGYAWAGTIRRVIQLGVVDQSAYAARSPRDIVFTFDDNRARRTARIGQTLYVTGGIPLQYDGLQLSEVGFLIYPWFFQPTVGAAGALSAGTYTWKSTMRWMNGAGELDRSTTATGMQLTVAASKQVNLAYMNLYVTLRQLRVPNHDVWRQQVGAALDAPFYLVSGQDPAQPVGISNNGYIANNDAAAASVQLVDNFADAVLTNLEQSPEVGEVLEYIAPPGAQVILATDTRLFLGAVSGDPDGVWYSRVRGVGEVASFNDTLRFEVPTTQGGAGPITAIVLNNETLTVFRETAIYAFPGVGLDNNGLGSNYGPAKIVSLNVGAISQETVALTPEGTIFKSRKGWYLLGADWSPRYIGAKAAEFDGDTVLAIDVIETQHQVRILSAARMLVWDYLVESEPSADGMRAGQWSEWTITDGLDAVMWRGRHVYLTSTGAKVQADNHVGVAYGLDVETAWIKGADLQGMQRVRWLELLGEYRSSFLARIRCARDYRYDGAGNVVYDDDVAWAPSPTVVGSALQVRHAPSQGACQAFKVRITAVAAGAVALLNTMDLGPVTVPTITTPWNAQLVATSIGVMGNAVSLNVSMESNTGPAVIDVRDHFIWDSTLQRWRESLNTIGVRIAANEFAPPTIGQLQAAISAGTVLAVISSPDGAGKVMQPLSVDWNQVGTAQFSGGAYGAPTGESLKLTGLGLEVGVKPGLYRRLSAAQKV